MINTQLSYVDHYLIHILENYISTHTTPHHMMSDFIT